MLVGREWGDAPCWLSPTPPLSSRPVPAPPPSRRPHCRAGRCHPPRAGGGATHGPAPPHACTTTPWPAEAAGAAAWRQTFVDAAARHHGLGTPQARVERDQVGVRRAGVPSRAGGAGRGVGRTAGACGSPASGGGSKRLSPPQSGRRPCPHTQRRRAGLAPVSHLGGKNVRAQEGASLCRGRAKGVSRSDFFVPFLVVCLPHFLNTPAQPSPRDVWANKWCGAAFLVLHQEKQ